jgi:hypothetical protein
VYGTGDGCFFAPVGVVDNGRERLIVAPCIEGDGACSWGVSQKKKRGKKLL